MARPVAREPGLVGTRSARQKAQEMVLWQVAFGVWSQPVGRRAVEA